MRPYRLVGDLDAEMAAVEASGAVVAVPPTEIPGEGRFALFLVGGIEHGIWQRPADR